MNTKSAGITTFLRHRVEESVGIALIFFSLYTILVLYTHSPMDPSFNNATPSFKIHNNGGLVGAYLSDTLLQYFGLASYLLPVVMGFIGGMLTAHKPPPGPMLLLTTVPLLLICGDVLYQVVPGVDSTGTPAGLVGKLVAIMLLKWLGTFGTIFVSFAIFVFCTMWLLQISLHDVYNSASRFIHLSTLVARQVWRILRRIHFRKSMQIDLPLPISVHKKSTPKVERAKKEKSPTARAEEEKQTALPLNLSDNYVLPPLHLLEERPSKENEESEEALTQNARQIETQLANFGVQGNVTKICTGPVITIYELEPAAGVKTSSIINLSDDLARAMSAISVRIAPIPGRNVIGVELPNLHRKMVNLRDLLMAEEFETHPGKLTVSLGVDTSGTPVYADISSMPHALIAGTTGSGKSVAMNAFILSLLYRMTPEHLRFVMIDPKMLELSIYNDIPHLLTPVITDPNKASAALKWAVREMERRYKMMAELGVKNLQSFNARFIELQAEGKVPTKLVQTGFNKQTGQPNMEEQPLCDSPLPYIVVVIDELADLMMVAGKQVEQSIARLAQMARASGIHLLVATQRPSVDVVTGLIKANIPTRMSFNVTSRVDSRTVLDQMGAEQLLGKGDMLYMGNGSGALERIHGAFVSEEECHAIANHLKSQGQPGYVEDIFKEASIGNENAESGVTDSDPLYQQAIEVVAKEQKASTSFIQRHLKIGYNRAATLIEKMESDGLIGSADHVGKREVIMRKPPEEGY